MSSYETISLSIVICSMRPVNTCALLSTLIPQIRGKDQISVIFDIEIEPQVQSILSSINNSKSIDIFYNNSNKGLSYCRNFGMVKAKNPYIVFFDDDVFLPQKILDKYRRCFAQGVCAFGGPLKLPEFYQQLPRWLPNGLSSLLGIHTSQKRVWGGNFGFDLEIALQKQIFFKDSLGRKDGKLQSGDETDFFKRYCLDKTGPHFIEELAVYHVVDSCKFRLSYFIKRAFWQGRSEKRKQSVFTGIQKEFQRALHTSEPKISFRILQRTIGMLLFLIFCLGILREIAYREK